MKLLHVGHSGIHVNRVVRMFSEHGPSDLIQSMKGRNLTDDERKAIKPNLVVVHSCTDNPNLCEGWRCPVVGWVWNDAWNIREELYRKSNACRSFKACDLYVGDSQSKAIDRVPSSKWLGILPAVEKRIFSASVGVNGRNVPIFMARGWAGREVYWNSERREAVKGMSGVVWADGNRTPQEMADLYRRSRCVVALREDSGPAFTVVEAALCGSIPVVSDCPQIRKHFTRDGRVVGCVLAKRNAKSILSAIQTVLRLSDEEYVRFQESNFDYFSEWTDEAQASKIVESVFGVLR